ncbi:MAG: hypothetical protein KC656_04755 [Myxococcales bacterium]|nr:hypothetical protein [Myxococcales bacterium]
MRAPERVTATWDLGVSERGVVVSETLAQTLRVVAFGPVPSADALDPELADVVETSLQRELRSLVPREDARDDMERTARAVDSAIRESLGDGRSEHRGTLVAATVREGRLSVAQTGHGTALLFRLGDLLTIAPDSDRTTSEWHPWLGSRRKGDEGNPLLLHTNDAPVVLQPGDRVVLCSAPPSHLISLDTFVALATSGTAEMAAESLADVLEVQLGLADVAVAVLDWAVEHDEDEGPDLDSGLLAGLTDLIADITEELDILPATPAPSPERTHTPEPPDAREAPPDAPEEEEPEDTPDETTDPGEDTAPELPGFDPTPPAPTDVNGPTLTPWESFDLMSGGGLPPEPPVQEVPARSLPTVRRKPRRTRPAAPRPTLPDLPESEPGELHEEPTGPTAQPVADHPALHGLPPLPEPGDGGVTEPYPTDSYTPTPPEALRDSQPEPVMPQAPPAAPPRTLPWLPLVAVALLLLLGVASLLLLAST